LKKITVNDGLAAAVCLFLFVILPFVYSSETLDPEIAPRFIVLSIFCAVFFFIFLFSPKHFLQHFEVLSQPFFIFLLLWLLITALAALKAINPGDGVFALLQRIQFVLVVILLSKIFFRGERHWKFLAGTMMISVFIFSYFGLKQVIDESRKLHAVGENLNRLLTYITSTLANKNFWAETFLLFLPLLIWGAINFKKIVRLLSLLTLLIVLATIALLQSVSVWLALLLAIASFVSIFLFNKNFKVAQTRKLRVAALAVVFVIAAFFVFGILFTSSESKFSAAKLLQYTSTDVSASSNENDNSTYERVMLWRNTLQLIKENPLLGAGLSNWKISQGQFGIGGTPFINSGLVHYEHPHNEFLFVCAETGLTGLLLLLLLFALLLRMLLYLLSHSINLQEKFFILLLICAFVGLFVLCNLGYPLQRTYSSILIALLFAIVVSKYASLRSSKKIIPSLVLRIFFLFAGMISSFSIYAGIQRYHAERNLRDALSCKTLYDWNCMAILSKRADNFFFPVDYGGTPVDWYAGVAYGYDHQRDSAKKYLLKAVAENSNHVLVLSDLGAIFQQEGKYDSAVYLYKKALKITPQFATAQLNLSVAFYNAHKIDSAFSSINKVDDQSFTKYPEFKIALGEILYTKAFLSLQKQSKGIEDSVWQAKIEDRDWLISLYNEGRENNVSFEQLLEKKIR